MKRVECCICGLIFFDTHIGATECNTNTRNGADRSMLCPICSSYLRASVKDGSLKRMIYSVKPTDREENGDGNGS